MAKMGKGMMGAMGGKVPPEDSGGGWPMGAKMAGGKKKAKGKKKKKMMPKMRGR